MNSQVKLGISFAAVVLVSFGGVVHMTKFPEPGELALAPPDEASLSWETRNRIDDLAESVAYQAHEIGRRSSRFSPQQQFLVEFLEASLDEAGLEVELQEYEAKGTTFHNVVGTRKGTGAGTLFIGTHYDSYGKSPCGNAVATGVSAVIESLSILKGRSLDRTIVVGLFGTGEKPHRGEATMGAQVWLDRATEDGLEIDEALIVSSFGVFSGGVGLQKSSFPWYLMYPDTADWVAFYAPFSAKEDATAALRRWDAVTDLPARGFAAPQWMLGMPTADQGPFLDAGIPTIVVSDTGSERDSVFRSKGDDAYHIDYRTMALRVEALADFVERWANEPVRSR
ncbi:MAG: M28 family peptidase [Planctomycetota bacterium]